MDQIVVDIVVDLSSAKSNMKTEQQVLILGGGLAGLTAAYNLHKEGISFSLVEARERLGGRVHTLKASDMGTVEMGATWFADKHVNLMGLIAELDLAYELQYVGTRMLYDFGNPQRTIQLVDLPPGQEPSYILSHGSQSLIDAFLDRIPSASVRLNETVLSIESKSDLLLTETDQASYASSFVINTLPPALFHSSVSVEPTLPEAFKTNAKKTHTWMGESIKVGLKYKEPFWRGHHIGTFFSQFGPIQELHDHIHDAQQVPFLKGFLHPQFGQMNRQELEDSIHQQMRNYFGPDVPEPEAIYLSDWKSEPFTYQEYEGYVGPHQNNGLPIFRETYLSDRLIFAGSETAQHFPGYMDGAVERGQAVAKHLIEHINAS